MCNENITLIRLTNENNRFVYMKYQSTPKKAIYIIELDTFRKLWNSDRTDEWSRRYSYADKSELKKDSKYERAEEGFSRGYDDPVPVADISLRNTTSINTCISIVDGYTRIIWLIANGYKYIPVSISTSLEDFKYQNKFESTEGVFSINMFEKLQYVNISKA